MRALALAGCLALAACSTPAPGPPGPPPATSPTRSPDPTPTEPDEPRFRSAISRIDRSDVASSWRAGCPVAFDRLRLVRLSFWGFDGAAHRGELVVHGRHARAVARVFRTLFEARFPIRRMVPVDAYGAADDRSMEADNTSGFNCRRATGSGRWSEHAYGGAIDIDPVENPFVSGEQVLPPAGRAYLDRGRVRPGMIVRGDVVVRAFASIGWRWGGDYRTIKDYQHFSATGR